MLTPQEVSSRAFSKAAFGGYNMAMVDDFLDELTDDYTALYKENAALKAKMKVLVDKVEEYRATEDSMRAALLSAQKMASTMVEEAESKKASLLANAEVEARAKLGSIREELLFEQKRLNNAKAAMTDFMNRSRAVCESQLKLLEQLPDLTPADLEAPVAEEKEAEELAGITAIGEKILSEFEPKSEEAEEDIGVQQDLLEPDDNPFVETATRAIDLSELKFGRNYKADE